jgi:replicative DNA helicase
MKLIEQPQEGDWLRELQVSCNKLLRATGKCKILVVIDLLQRMDVSAMLPGEPEKKSPGKLLTDMQKDDFRLDAIKRFRDWSRNESMPTGAPVVVISEIRKGEDTRRELTLEDIKGSGRIAFDADTVLLMMTPKSTDGSATVPVTLRIAKARDGATRTDISLMFHHTVYNFTEIEPSSKKAKAPRLTPGGDSFDPMAGK